MINTFLALGMVAPEPVAGPAVPPNLERFRMAFLRHAKRWLRRFLGSLVRNERPRKELRELAPTA